MIQLIAPMMIIVIAIVVIIIRAHVIIAEVLACWLGILMTCVVTVTMIIMARIVIVPFVILKRRHSDD